MKVRRLTQLSMFTIIAVTIFTIEAALPALTPIQGVKLGLANIVTLVLFKFYRPGEVFLVLIARIFLSTILGGQMIMMFYSLGGGVLCFFAMWLIHKLLQGHYLPLTSIVGAIFHNIGQIVVALCLLQSHGILVYVPLLMISAIVSGLFTGLCAHFFCKKMSNIMNKI